MSLSSSNLVAHSHSRLPPLEQPLDSTIEDAFENITDLTIRNSLLSWRDVSTGRHLLSKTQLTLTSMIVQVLLLSTSFPNLERLDVAANPLCSSRPGRQEATSGFSKVRELVVGDCDISAWEDVVDMFGNLPVWV
jgi:hypothetical protein